MKEYITIRNTSTGEYTEKRSKFIATLVPCNSEKDALDIIQNIRSQYWDATHNVFAYIIEQGNVNRFSDDGEPHGTAGKPIYDIISGYKLSNVVIVVTRYFGGVLLGTGGLVRAYSNTAKEAVLNSEIINMIPCTEFKIQCNYQDYSRLLSLIKENDGIINNTSFTESIVINYILKNTLITLFESKLTETFSAKIHSEKICETLYSFNK